MAKLDELINKIISKIEITTDRVIFTTLSDEKDKYNVLKDGLVYHAYHNQDCCEDVFLEKVIGSITNILISPVLSTDEKADSINHPEDYIENIEDSQESFTWTYHTIRTKNGEVTFRWLGTSNGYYGESVYFGLGQ